MLAEEIGQAIIPQAGNQNLEAGATGPLPFPSGPWQGAQYLRYSSAPVVTFPGGIISGL
jgi:hypothetical protein